MPRNGPIVNLEQPSYFIVAVQEIECDFMTSNADAKERDLVNMNKFCQIC